METAKPNYLLFILCLVLSFLILIQLTSKAQSGSYHSPEKNYLVTFKASSDIGNNIFNPEYQISFHNSIKEDIIYYNDFGRIEQEVYVKASPSINKDIIKGYSFEGYGRLEHMYLPYAKDSYLHGIFNSNLEQEQKSYYDQYMGIGEGDYAYDKFELERSVIPEFKKVHGPGRIWNHNTSKYDEQRWELNESNSIHDFKLDLSNEISRIGFYPQNSLKLQIITDPDDPSKQTETIMVYDAMGNKICERRKLAGFYEDTYFIYDELYRLVHVLQPEGFYRINGNWSLLNDANFRENWVFSFEYDNEIRLQSRKVPAAGKDDFVYDNFNRIILSQNSLQRGKKDWTFYQYDKYNRLLAKGYKTIDMSRSNLQQSADAWIASGNPIHEIKIGGNEFGYTNNTYQSNPGGIMEVVYYDHYDFDRDGSPDYSLNYSESENDPQLNEWKEKPLFLKTGAIYRSLSNPSNFRKEILFYDNLDRIIQIQKVYSLVETQYTDIINFDYDIQGNVKKKEILHRLNDPKKIKIKFRYEYDHRGRLLREYQKINEDEEKLIYDLKYNDLGKLISKKIQSNPEIDSYLQKIDYKYNIRGWLKSINQIDLPGNSNSSGQISDLRTSALPAYKDIFAMELVYTKANQDGIPSHANFDGNISQIKWQNILNPIPHAYGFWQDKKDQLTDAHYRSYDSINNSWTLNSDHFSLLGVQYDKNGNIQSLGRMGLDVNNNSGMVDNLIYNYEGNRVMNINDLSNLKAVNDFKNRTYFGNSGQRFYYDANGNMSHDMALGIDIAYNYENLANIIDFNGLGFKNIEYGSNGQKWSSTLNINGSSEIRLDYIGDFIYQNGEILFIRMNGGQIIKDKGTGEFRNEYYFEDHLGNIRLIYSDLNGNGRISKNEILQENHYYPFGLEILALKSQQVGSDRFLKFNGKEQYFEGIDTDKDGILNHFINVYDFGSRLYSPAIGRWWNCDPESNLFQEYSPYNYVFNNPFKLNDPNGKVPGDPLKEMEVRDNRASNLQGKVRNNGTRIHQGFDLEAPVGTEILAVKNGTIHKVIKNESSGGAYGKQVILKFKNSEGKIRYAQYSHLSELEVEKGDKVIEGQILGKTGRSGNAFNTTPHLHFELRDQDPVGRGLKGRIDPNEILDTKFYPQDSKANQTKTGVYKQNNDGSLYKINLDGSGERISLPSRVPFTSDLEKEELERKNKN